MTTVNEHVHVTGIVSSWRTSWHQHGPRSGRPLSDCLTKREAPPVHAGGFLLGICRGAVASPVRFDGTPEPPQRPLYGLPCRDTLRTQGLAGSRNNLTSHINRR